MCKAFDKWAWYHHDIHYDLKSRGLDDPKVLPKYYFREDITRIFDAMLETVTELIDLYYKDENDIKEDYELQAFYEDLKINGWKVHELPETVTKDFLIRFLTIVVFTASARHAAINFSQYDYYSFIPIRPMSMNAPPPTQKGTVNSEEDVLKYLPNPKTASKQIKNTFVLSKIYPDIYTLYNFHTKLFTDEAPINILLKFKAKMAELAKSIEVRNSKLTHPYPYCNPKRIPMSIDI